MPNCTILVGVPGSGKSTWIKNYDFDRVCCVISTDDTVHHVAAMYGMTYNEGFRDLIGFAEKVMWRNLREAAKGGQNIIIDRTNMTAKSRKKFIDFLKPYGYDFGCVVCEIPEIEEWLRRLDSRPGKTIPQEALDRMVASYEAPTKAEGFSTITFNSCFYGLTYF